MLSLKYVWLLGVSRIVKHAWDSYMGDDQKQLDLPAISITMCWVTLNERQPKHDVSLPQNERILLIYEQHMCFTFFKNMVFVGYFDFTMSPQIHFHFLQICARHANPQCLFGML